MDIIQRDSYIKGIRHGLIKDQVAFDPENENRSILLLRTPESMMRRNEVLLK